MAITTYAELQTAISDRLSRVDLTATVVQECIALFEADAQDILETLDQATVVASVAISGEYSTVPAGLVEVLEFSLNTTPRKPIRHLTGDTQTTWYPALPTGDPIFFEIVAGYFRFSPVPSGAFTATLAYSTRFAALSGSATSNWLLTKYPDAYLYGSLCHACEKTQDYQLADRYGQRSRGILSRINRRNRKTRWSGPGFQVRPG